MFLTDDSGMGEQGGVSVGSLWSYTPKLRKLLGDRSWVAYVICIMLYAVRQVHL